ncbi:meiosis-specific kinetochore protein isoform X2 [Pithys albifrons albifrons]|uniref:meiosis-specific kinetochore protein isoform X2 n=1 Tax=Pithys albifrons albifrons TaxID=3385563 RepID=UPI003A5CBF88
MERGRAPRPAKAPRHKRAASPLPEAAPPRRTRPAHGPAHTCRRSLFGRGPNPAGMKKKFSAKSLPKIKENAELTGEIPSCSQSNPVNVRETTDLKEKEEESEESSVRGKEFSTVNFESKEIMKTGEVTSSTGMTLPTGVSTFFFECLSVESITDFSNTNDSLNSCSSPETFRDDNSERTDFHSVALGKYYKNSTLLDSSKAVTIDKIPQISNLSAILEPVPKDLQDQCSRRKRPSNCNFTSSAFSVSTTVAGKKLCKITAARERTPDLKSGMRSPSPVGPESKPAKRSAKYKRLKGKKKEDSCNPSEASSSSFRQRDAPGNTSARAGGLAAEVVPNKVVPNKVVPTKIVPTKSTDSVLQTASTMLVTEEDKAPESPGNVQLAQLDPLCDRKETCSIVRLSPVRKPSRPQPVPVQSQEWCCPGGVPEDTVRSTKTWTCCRER